MLARLLGWLLHNANASPPSSHRDAFYALKDRLLRRYGSRTGADIQHIRRPCWDGPCDRCSHTGIWSEFWVHLERWQLGAYPFHRPHRRTSTPPFVPVTITGSIRHADPGPLASECALWLALCFDRPLFLQLLTGSMVIRWTAWPLTLLQQAGYRLRRTWRRHGLRRCDDCGRLFLRLLQTTATRCAPCAHVSTVRVQTLGDDLPF
jgi:hypothetical protein